jgi:hypothetical protein
MSNHNKSLFDFFPILPHIIIIAAALGGYYFIRENGLFYDWQTFIYYGLKALIALEIILASARSFLAPDLTGQLISDYTSDLITSVDGWQLLVVSMVGLLITALIRLK